ncbi:MAG: hypothetical protein IKW96_08745 [Ruminococcus sp.]|uniref:hypothetical protein n=1 Tax=Ruminococcus sp. TaxID=41978 RepID=UPI0025EA6C14|nr:hypothetical protein [Ruminococcus sp.]MBR5683343.1 hypothetical protein [Ruminococcus sp.]
METAEVIAVSVAALLIAAEIVCLYLCSKLKCKNYPMCILLPIHNEDSEFTRRLDCIGTHIEEGDPLIGTVLLMDMGANETQIQHCREFCQRYHAAEIILPEDMESSMKKYLHFS